MNLWARPDWRGRIAAVARLLFCAPEFPPAPGGSPALFAALARLWREAGGESVVYTIGPPGHRATGATIEGGVRVRRFARRRTLWPRIQARVLGAASRLGPLRWRSATGFPYLLTRGYRRFLRDGAAASDGPFALVVCGVLPHTHFVEPALRFAARHDLPSLVVPLLHAGLLDHHPPRHVLGPGAASLLRAADRVAALTEAEIEPLRRLGVGAGRIAVTGAAVDLNAPIGDARAFARRHGLEGAWILQAGGLSADKGTLDLIAAHAARRAGGAAQALVLIGRPEPEVCRAVAALPARVGHTVVLLDRPDPADWHGALAGAALLAHPSRAESFGLVLLEAWQVGVPVVAARAGGPACLVRDGTDGLLVTPGDRAELAAAIDRLLADPRLTRRLGTAGRARVRTGLTWRHVFPRWERLFREILAR